MQQDQYLHPDWVNRVFAVDRQVILLISILDMDIYSAAIICITPQRDLPEPSWVDVAESPLMNDMELL
jgi:hypothetical protein